MTESRLGKMMGTIRGLFAREEARPAEPESKWINADGEGGPTAEERAIIETIFGDNSHGGRIRSYQYDVDDQGKTERRYRD